MADSKISQLPPVTGPLINDVVPCTNGGAAKKLTLKQIRKAATDLDVFSVTDYGYDLATTNGFTSALAAAITDANALRTTYVYATVTIPEGSYSIHYGSLPDVQCHVIGPGASLVCSNTANTPDEAAFTICSKDNRLEFQLNAMYGYYVQNDPQDWRNSTPYGTGIHIKGATDASVVGGVNLRISRMLHFDTALLLYGGADDYYPGHNHIYVKEFMLNNTAIRLQSGGTEYNEANIFNINYLVGNKKHIHLKETNGTSWASNIGGNTFLVNSVELHLAPDLWEEHFIRLEGSRICHNNFEVSTVIIPPLTGTTGFIINSTGGAIQNYFKLPNTDFEHFYMDAPSVIDMSADMGLISLVDQFPSLAGKGRSNLYSTAPPTVGSWRVGDKCWNIAPTAGGSIGWVCVTAGMPGTWKTFGTIAN